jgi:type IV secretory pathway VirB3-like protein
MSVLILVVELFSVELFILTTNICLCVIEVQKMLNDNERKMQDMQLTWQERLEQARYDVHMEYLMT